MKFFIALVLFEVFVQLFLGSMGWGIWNQGFSFGIGQNLFPRAVYLLFALALAFVLIKKRVKETGWWLVVAGGISNGLVRVFTGQVWDYWHWNYLFSIWFNTADILITLGFVLILFDNGKRHG